MGSLRRRLERLERAGRAPQSGVELEALASLSDEELLELEALVEIQPLPRASVSFSHAPASGGPPVRSPSNRRACDRLWRR